jgi:hypothetical protein
MTALPNAKSTLSSAIDTDNKPYADATATTQETVNGESSVKLELQLHRRGWGALVFLLGRILHEAAPFFVSSRRDWTNARETENRA